MSTASSQLQGLRCVECGGRLRSTRDPQLHRCQHCERLQIQCDDAGVEAFAPAGRLGRRRSAAALREFLHARGVRGHEVKSLRLRWLPFWQVEGRLVGWMRYRVAREAQPGEEFSQAGLIDLKEESVARPVQLSMAACDARGMGLLGLAYRLEGLRLRPLSLDALGPDEEACAVLMPASMALRRARDLSAAGLLPKGAQRAVVRHSLIRSHLRLIYYPLWIVRYQVRGRELQLVLDGMSGRALAGAAPRLTRDHSPSWLGAAAISGFVAGWSGALGVVASLAWAAHRSRRDAERARRIGVGAWLSDELDGSGLAVESIRGGGSRP